MSPQADYVVSNGTGAAVRSDINGQLAAIVSNNSGASAPATTYAYQFWADTSTNLLKLRNGANSAFITVGDLTAANLGLATLASPTFTGTATIPTLTVSTAANIPLGSAASPTLYFTGDSNTGLYSPGADQVALSTGGTGRLFIDSSGRCGIGTSSPTGLLTVAASAPAIDWTNSSNTAFKHTIEAVNYSSTAANNTFAFKVASGSGTQATIMTLNGAGNVGIGSTAPNYELQINASDALSAIQLTNTSTGTTASDGFIVYNNGVNATISNEESGYLRFQTAGTERAQIDSSGRLLVGTSSWSSSDKLVVRGNTSGDDEARFSLVRGTVPAADQNIGVLHFQQGSGNEGARITALRDGGTWTAGSSHPTRLSFSTTSDSASSPTERVRITSTGRLMCGRDTRDATLESTDQFVIEGAGYQGYHALNATAYTIGQNSNSRALRIGSGSGWATTGVSLAAGGTSWGTYSDERLKTDIVELSDCLDSIKDIRCISYRLTDVDTDESKKRLGIIAQDLVGKYDEAINESRRSDDDETEYLSVQYTDLVPVLIKALQEASSKIETLEARLSALESA